MKHLLLLCLGLAFCSGLASAESLYSVQTARTIGLGHSGAMAEDVIDSIGNPLYMSGSWFTVSVFGGGVLRDLDDSVDLIRVLGEDYDLSDGSSIYSNDSEYRAFLDDLRRLDKDWTGVNADGSGGIGFSVRSFRFIYAKQVNADLDTEADLVNIDRAPFSVNYLGNNQTAVTLGALVTDRFTLGYAHKVFGFPTGLGDAGLVIGGNATLFRQSVSGLRKGINDELWDEFDSGDVYDELTSDANTRTSSVFDVDLAVGVHFTRMLEVTLVGSNLLAPKLRFKGGEERSVQPQARAMVKISPHGLMNIGVDFDFISRESLTENLKYQELGTGVEFNVAFFHPRVGVSYNFAESTGALHAGVGFSFAVIEFGLGAEVGLGQKIIGAALDLRVRV